MNKEATNLTAVTSEDLSLIERKLTESPRPLQLRELVEKLAFAKTADQRSKEVKKYDPNVKYEVGDFIYKEYNEPLTVGSKVVEHFVGSVVLQVTAKTYSDHFKCEMLELDYPGGGLFRKYVDYMKKTHTQVLLPSNLECGNQKPEVMAKDDDPRLTELPMTERDLKTLEKRLRTEMSKNPLFFKWGDYWHVMAKQPTIGEKKIKEIEKEMKATGESAATEDLVRKFFGFEASHDLFDLYCLSLNFILDKKYKKDFTLLSSINWGKWHLKKILNAMPDKLPLSAKTARLPEHTDAEKPQLSAVQAFPIKVYLTWREILSGGIKIPRSLNKELSSCREYIFTDTEEGKAYTLYYFPNHNIFLGLKDYYERFNIPQGTSLTLEKSGPNTFNFWVKKSKKKISVPRLSYDVKKDEFQDTGEEVYSFAEPNKIIFIEAETLTQLLSLTEEREKKDLLELLVLVFKTLAVGTTSHSLHFLRAYHLVDVLCHTTQEDVESTLLNSEDFKKSEKKKGIFIYREPSVPEIEEPLEIPMEEEVPEIPPLEESPTAEPSPSVEAEAVEEVVEEPAEAVFVEPVARPKEKPKGPPPEPKKEKPHKRKKTKADAERGPRPRKSERRVLEEKIEEEESMQAALSAVKEKEEVVEELRAKDKREEFTPLEDKEEPKFGVFAEMLKTALEKKEDDIPEKEPPKTKKKAKG